eukprot:1157363-Pelagomonas_calceolata.AAC.1
MILAAPQQPWRFCAWGRQQAQRHKIMSRHAYVCGSSNDSCCAIAALELLQARRMGRHRHTRAHQGVVHDQKKEVSQESA